VGAKNVAIDQTRAKSAADDGSPALSSQEKAEARAHLAEMAESQRAARGTMEFVSAPRARRRGRRIGLSRVWHVEFAGFIWRQIVDSHKRPGRWARRLLLYRPLQTLSIWVVIWTALATACAIVAFVLSTGELVDWLGRWGLGGSVAALVAVIWHDVIKSPHTAWRVRRRIIEAPEALLRSTLAKQATKIVELDPPVNTVPRDELYEELLPGALARKKDVQIVVGVPGAGKTTALLDLASVLAKIGLVPILLELRGERTSEDLFDLARKRFEQQVRPLVRTGADADIVWRWLCRRQRLAILVDDIDQIGFDGEPGFLMRRLLESVATEGQATIVTARPAGVPVGIAASAITMEPLAFQTAVDLVASPAMREPGATTSAAPPRRRIERWVQGGDLTEAPLYLEALAELTAVGACPDLPDDPKRWGEQRRPGRWRRLSNRRREWNPIWVRYMLLDRFHARIVDGKVRPSLAIDRCDRERSMRALQGAALGMLGASGLAAKAAADHGDEPEETRTGRPKRTALVEFISTDDRQGFDPQTIDAKVVRRRREVSQHEAIDSGERLRILECDWHGDPQFRHRIMQAFLAGRALAELGRRENAAGKRDSRRDDSGERVMSFDDWVEVLIDHHHPEKLTAHLALTFAALYADERYLEDPRARWEGLGEQIATRLVEKVEEDDDEPNPAGWAGNGEAVQLDPMAAPDPNERKDPDDELIKLTTAANVVALIRPGDDASEAACLCSRILEQVETNEGAMRWTKLQALPAVAELGSAAWRLIWTHFTHDSDYSVRRAASLRLEWNACRAYPHLGHEIEARILHAGRRAANGLPLQLVEEPDWGQDTIDGFRALGWVLPAIVSGLGEELRADYGYEAELDGGGADGDGARASRLDSPEGGLDHARLQLEKLVVLAYEGNRHELEEALAQGFKADAMRHASDPAKAFTGPGWVVSNRRLVADVALPHAESWYARMLLYQALALYAIAGTSSEDTLDVFTNRLHLTRERHPLVRQAAKLARQAMQRAELGLARWNAFVWSDDVEDAGRLPTFLGHRAAQLVGDVALLVDLKEGSPPDRHGNFGHMEELPYCLSASPNRYEILGTGCPERCGWGFCPFRAASPDEPDEHRGISRGFCRGERRLTFGKRSPSWQRSIGARRLREFWQQMEYKARR
jgi:hypothetical protein